MPMKDKGEAATRGEKSSAWGSQGEERKREPRKGAGRESKRGEPKKGRRGSRPDHWEDKGARNR